MRVLGWVQAGKHRDVGRTREGRVNGRVQGEGSLLGQPIEMGSRHVGVPIATQAIGAKGIDGDQDHVPGGGPPAGLGLAGDHPRKERQQPNPSGARCEPT